MESIKVRYIGKSYEYWFGDKEYEAIPRYVRGKDKIPVKWEITDRDGDLYSIADGTIEEGLKKGWVLVSGIL